MAHPLCEKASRLFKERFQAGSSAAVYAPGRVNLIGEHTDYNGGYVLPAAIDRGVAIAGEAYRGSMAVLYSENFQEKIEFPLESPRPDSSRRWADYFKGMVVQLKKKGLSVSGCRAVITGDLPQGAGLSSSAALEVAAAAFLAEINGFSIRDMELVKAAQAAENEFVGVQCGIMDQFASFLGKQGRALFLDCRSLDHQWVPIPSGHKIVVCDSGVKRNLAGSAYNERREQCAEGVKILGRVLPGVKSLRDVSPEELEKNAELLDGVIRKRCRHVVTENQRVLDAVEALGQDRMDKVKVLMEESHESLKNDYEVSCPELDLLVDLAKSRPGVLGSRMTGAGFGGCTVNFVKDAAVEDFVGAVGRGYEAKTGRKPEVYVLAASDGARIINTHF